MSDLETLATVVREFGPSALPAGSAGLAVPLAAAWHPDPGDARPAPVPRVAGRILLLVSSANVEGVPLSATIGAAHEGLVVVTKAGGFGDDGTLLNVIRALRG